MNSPVVVSFDKVNFSYTQGIKILNDVSFEICENEYVCIVGHNGSGKSTISKVLMGLLKPSSGKITILDKVLDEYNLKDIRNDVGIVFQNPDNQFVGMTTEDDIAFGLENRRVPTELMQPIINTAAKITNISHLLKKEPSQLSGGQKQKVAITSVLAINPSIMIFDESTSMLDPKSKEELKQLMLELKNQYNKTIISITHDMEEVVHADKVIVLEKGNVVCVGKPSDIFTDIANLNSLKLDFPFTLKLASLLNENNCDVKLTLDYKELIDNICKIMK